ncbi:hypothetical protein MN608_00696 [Microdochium nivale]|nr:hypothetical protein MN608_00696 [Microdochium nivale]
MSPKAVSTTARDLELLVLAWQSLKTAPQVDYELFAQKAGYKNATTAKTQFGTLRKKLFALAVTAADGSTAAVSAPPSTPRKRGPAGAGEGTPSKKPYVKKEEQHEQEDEQEEEEE